MARNKQIIKHTKTDSYIDKSTGEILDQFTKHHKIWLDDKDSFLLMYSSIISIFERMEQSEIRVYGYLLRYAEGLEFAISKSLRMRISEVTGLNERTIYNTIQVLKSKNLIYEKNSLFMVNPRYAFKGTSSSRKNAMNAMIEFGCKDC